MTATAAMIAEVRLMVAEPDDTNGYTDALIQEHIEDYPLLDERGAVPYTWDTSTDPPTQDENEEWIPTYDLNAAAAKVWQEKAASIAQDFDFQADGGSFSRSQKHLQYMRMASYYRARRSARTHTLHQYPEPGGADVYNWVGNRPEEED